MTDTLCLCGYPLKPATIEAANLVGRAECSACGSLVTLKALKNAQALLERDQALAAGGLVAARHHVLERLDDGVRCPCCGLFAKRYRRKLSSIMACWLIAFRRARMKAGLDVADAWLHVDKVAGELRSITSVRSGDYGKLRFWNLLEPKEGGIDELEGQKATGVWRLTEKGEAFVAGTVRVPRYAVVFDNAAQGYEGEEIGIHEALGSRFSYQELMSA